MKIDDILTWTNRSNYMNKYSTNSVHTTQYYSICNLYKRNNNIMHHYNIYYLQNTSNAVNLIKFYELHNYSTLLWIYFYIFRNNNYFFNFAFRGNFTDTILFLQTLFIGTFYFPTVDDKPLRLKSVYELNTKLISNECYGRWIGRDVYFVFRFWWTHPTAEENIILILLYFRRFLVGMGANRNT